jgi:hypothetical protein
MPRGLRPVARPRLACHERYGVVGVEDFSGGTTPRIGAGRIDQRAAVSISRRKQSEPSVAGSSGRGTFTANWQATPNQL